MVAYVFDKSNYIIHTKINKVSLVDDNTDNDGKIVGEGEIAIFGLGSDYTILPNDTINLSVGDKIVTDNLEDARNYFLLGKETWYQEQMTKQKEKMDRILHLLEIKEEKNIE